MEDKIPKDYIANIAKATAYFVFRNGPIKDLYKNNKISDDEVRSIQTYIQNHMAYLYDVLLEENNLKKFDLIISTMNKFYVNDSDVVKIEDDGFDNFYEGLFPKNNNIKIK